MSVWGGVIYRNRIGASLVLFIYKKGIKINN